MNNQTYDLNTTSGMANSVEWLNQFLRHLVDGGVWHVPRSNTAYTINKPDKVATKIFAQDADPSLDQVFKAAGYTVVTK